MHVLDTGKTGPLEFEPSSGLATTDDVGKLLVSSANERSIIEGFAGNGAWTGCGWQNRCEKEVE